VILIYINLEINIDFSSLCIYINIYKEEKMVKKAKVFTSGGSQAVRLPKEFRFEDDKEVFIKKLGKIVILIPQSVNVWKDFFYNPEKITSDFMEAGI
jgi:antitoxin VapB